MLVLHGHTQAVSCSQLHGHTQAANSWLYTEKYNTFLASEQNEHSFGQYISLQFLHILYTTMAGEEESLQLRIDVSLDQDKDENQEEEEIIYSKNSDVDVVNLESDCHPSGSSSSSDSNMSGPEHVEIISPNTPPKVFKSASKRFSNLSFAERCYHIINYLHSPESDRVYPYFITHKWDKTSGKGLNPSDGMNTGKSCSISTRINLV